LHTLYRCDLHVVVSLTGLSIDADDDHHQQQQQQGEQRTEVESVRNRTLTQADRKDLAAENNKSAITDHVAKQNCIIGCFGAKILDRESHRKTRQLCIQRTIRRAMGVISGRFKSVLRRQSTSLEPTPCISSSHELCHNF